MLRSFAASLVLLFASLAPAVAGTAEANRYVESIGNQVLSVLSSNAGKDQKQTRLEKMFAENVDIPWVGRFVMGRYWKQASEAQKSRYLKAYQRFLIKHYTKHFTDYTGGSFKVIGSTDNGGGEYHIRMEIQPGSKEPIMSEYMLRRAGDSFKINDIVIEGVSMITTQRSEFASVIGRNGIDHLIEQLETRSESFD